MPRIHRFKALNIKLGLMKLNKTNPFSWNHFKENKIKRIFAHDIWQPKSNLKHGWFAFWVVFMKRKTKKKQKTGITNAKFSFIHSRMMQFIINQKLNHIWGIWILQHKGLSRQNYMGDPKKKEVKKNRGDTNNYNSFGNIAPPIKVFKLKVVTPLW